MTMAKLLSPMVKAWARWVTVRWTKNHPSKFQGGRGFRAGGDLGWVEGPIYQRKTLRAFFLLGGTTGFLLRALWLDSGDWKNITTKHGDLHPMGSESVHQKSLEKNKRGGDSSSSWRNLIPYLEVRQQPTRYFGSHELTTPFWGHNRRLSQEKLVWRIIPWLVDGEESWLVTFSSPFRIGVWEPFHMDVLP